MKKKDQPSNENVIPKKNSESTNQTTQQSNTFGKTSNDSKTALRFSVENPTETKTTVPKESDKKDKPSTLNFSNSFLDPTIIQSATETNTKKEDSSKQSTKTETKKTESNVPQNTPSTIDLEKDDDNISIQIKKKSTHFKQQSLKLIRKSNRQMKELNWLKKTKI